MLTGKEKELIAIGASVAAGCLPCTEYHVKTARSAGACDRSLTLAVETALAVRQSATSSMDEWAGQCQGARPPLDSGFRAEKRRIAELTAVVAAFAVNSVRDLRARPAAARESGATPEQTQFTIAVAGKIKRVAEEKLAALIGELSGDAGNCRAAPAKPAACGCGSRGA